MNNCYFSHSLLSLDNMKKIILKKNEDRRILGGHLWAFSNEISEVTENPVAGDLVRLQSHQGKSLGIGFFNPHSLIAVRLLSDKQEDIDFDFFKRRIEAAYALRRKIYPTQDAFRLVHGEGDFLPGLIIDKFGDYLSVQTSSYGMENHLATICDVLESLFHPAGIVERNEAPVRLLEGLEQRKGVLRGSAGTPTINEGGINYSIDLLEGQKTGFFLDQRENRISFRRYAAGMTVLDCFCNEGGFALNAAFSGATEVTGVDISETAVSRAAQNAAANHLAGNVTFSQSDAFDFLEKSVQEGRLFDLINLDPPSFAKNKKTVRKAKRGYMEIHCNAMKILKKGGILSTASCSHNITEETFLDVITDSAREVGRRVALLEWHGASPDHPVLPSMPETKYLKFGIFHVE